LCKDLRIVSSNGDAWLVHAAAVLHDAGVRASAGRAAVTQVLARGDCLMSASDIRRRFEAESGVSASASTVYRTLELLHEHGLLRRIDAGDGIARYEPADSSGNDAHQHVVFDDGHVEPFTDAQLTRALAGLGKRLGVNVDRYELIVRAQR
jgi:Fur family transcriptional regulator, ferric uptake regulator